MVFIQHKASISHQDSFRSENLWKNLQKLTPEGPLMAPDYKEFIQGGTLRRLSPVLKMGLACAMECQKNLESNFDSISVGTALGCLQDTEKFLQTILTTTSDFLSPTAFIQSTHNTIAGQISLAMNNHGYNMTHTQNSISFELALIDGVMRLNDGDQNVLVGSADEHIPFLDTLNEAIFKTNYPLTSLSSFFVLQREKSETGIYIQDQVVHFETIDLNSAINQLLENNKLNSAEIGLILHSDLDLPFLSNKQENYLQYTGFNYSASAFALHLAYDALIENDQPVLIVNQLCSNNLGLILVNKQP